MNNIVNEILKEIIQKSIKIEKPIIKESTEGALSWSAIPEIPISEIGWSDLTTTDEGEKIPSEQRSQLENFLNNIPGDDLQSKLSELENFFKGEDEYLKTAGFVGQTNSDSVARLMSYLVFYKTLTTIITHFNAASAGFSFESFLGVMLGGQQVPTNSQTIADMIDGKGVPISLKLYKEGQLEVGGSFTDLAIDLMKTGQMQYVCVTKNLSGKGLKQIGALRFFRFNFNLQNIFNIISKSSIKSQRCMLLPKTFIESGGQQIEGLPSKKPEMPSPEVIESEFVEALNKMLEEKRAEIIEELGEFEDQDIRQALDFANSQALFGKNGIPGKNKMTHFAVSKTLAGLFNQKSSMLKTTKLVDEIVNINNNIIVPKYSREALGAERQAGLNELYFYDKNIKTLIENSRKFYEQADDELKKKCLEVSLGYVDTRHFGLTQGMIMKIADIAQPTPGELFPEGQESVGPIGVLNIGAANIQGMLDKVTGQLNKMIFDIFSSLKLLTTSIQGYFAGGLKDDKQADTAKEAANNIEKKTEEVQKGELTESKQPINLDKLIEQMINKKFK